MPVNTGYLSDRTTDFTSNVSVRGRVTWHSAISSPLLASFGTVQVGAGSAIMPSVAFNSENSLGWYRSAASQMALSYGELVVGVGSAILPSIGFASDVSRGFYRSAASTLALTSGLTFNWRTGAVKWSWDTRANASGMTTGELALVFLASGISLVFSSGASSYVIGQSTQSAAQA